MSSIQRMIKQRMDILQGWMEANYHLRRPDVVSEHISTVSKFWSALSEEDKDYIQASQNAIEWREEWK